MNEQDWIMERSDVQKAREEAEAALAERTRERDEWKQDAEDFSAVDEIKKLRAALAEAVKLLRAWGDPAAAPDVDAFLAAQEKP